MKIKFTKNVARFYDGEWAVGLNVVFDKGHYDKVVFSITIFLCLIWREIMIDIDFLK